MDGHEKIENSIYSSECTDLKHLDQMGWTKHEQPGWPPHDKGLITLTPILLLKYLLLISLTSPVFKQTFLFKKIFLLKKNNWALYYKKKQVVYLWRIKKNWIL